jgi:hypothetical protein
MPLFLLAFCFVYLSAFASDVTSNAELADLKKQDQAARSGGVNGIDWKKVASQDAERRRRVAEILREGEVRTAGDYFNAALIYQHGQTVDVIRLAYSLANVAATLDPENKMARWLTVAAWDRIMMRFGRPQWYGTQFNKPKDSETWQLYMLDETAVSDEDRKALGVPSLEESKARAAKIR